MTLASGVQARKVLAVSASEGIGTGDIRLAIARLRDVRDAARRLDDPELATALTKVIGLIRMGATGTAVAESVALTQLQEWASMRVPQVLSP